MNTIRDISSKKALLMSIFLIACASLLLSTLSQRGKAFAGSTEETTELKNTILAHSCELSYTEAAMLMSNTPRNKNKELFVSCEGFFE